MNELKKVLYPADIATETGIGIMKIYQMLQKNEIPHIKAGDRYLVSRKNFEAWLNGESQTKTA